MSEDAAFGEKMIQSATGAPISIIRRLETADDWTFIITIHAMLEAALNNLITEIEISERFREAHAQNTDRHRTLLGRGYYQQQAR
jgi:hypothetical protein